MCRNHLLTAFRNNDEFFRQRAGDLISAFQDRLPQIIKDAHVDTLLKSAVPELRVRWYGTFDWFVADVQGRLILPDSACLFELQDGRFKSVNDENDQVVRIYLPISSRRLLIGASAKPESMIGAEDFNQVAAQHSYELFVACECSPDLVDLSRQIGALAYLLTNEELEGLTQDAFAHVGLGTTRCPQSA